MATIVWAACALIGFSAVFPWKAKADLVTYTITFTASGFPTSPLVVNGEMSFTIDPTQSYGFTGATNPAYIDPTIAYWDLSEGAGAAVFYKSFGASYTPPTEAGPGIFNEYGDLASSTGLPIDDGGNYAVGSMLILTTAVLDTSGGSCATIPGYFQGIEQYVGGGWEFSSSCSYTLSATDNTSPPDGTPAPEPATLALFGSGLLSLAAVRRRTTGGAGRPT